MNIVDTHAHLNFPDFREDLETVIERSRTGGLKWLINVGTDLQSSRESVNLAGRYQFIYATVGVHPHDADRFADMRTGIKDLARDSKVVAIGEIGLDYYRDLSSHDNQTAAFVDQLQLALDVRKPIVIHCREAYNEVLAVLAAHYLPHLGGRTAGVVHSFAGSVVHAKKFLQAGFYIGLNNLITYPKNLSIQEAIKDIPLERIVLETDCPFLPPQALRGQRSEPLHVQSVAEAVAKIKNVSVDEVMRVTTANAESLFGL